MRALGSIALVTASAFTSALLVVLSHAAPAPPVSPLVGLYEPVATAAQRRSFDLEVLFLDWNDPHAVPQLQDFLARARQQQRLPLLTLEPFPNRADGRTNRDLLGDVLSGRHDAAISSIARTLAAHPGTVLLRFAHEMDKPGQYPWGYADSSRYLRLYHYVYDKVATERPTNLRWVWSPAGNSRADRYWPGDPYVDLIGLSIYASRAWTPDRSLEGFAEQLEKKRWLQQRFGRPLLVAEAGVSGSPADQQGWLREALASLPRFPEVCGLVYFHAPQPRWMPLPTGHEDWQLHSSVLVWLLNRLPLPSRQGLSCQEA
jgi:beta-mannanase